MTPETNDLDAGAQPTCPSCGTVMREVNGGYECAWDDTTIDVPRVERPNEADGCPASGDVRAPRQNERMLSTATLLDFEARHPGHPAGKQHAIETELGITAARYYQPLGRAIDHPDAVKLDPVLVHGLRRLNARAVARQRGRQRVG